MFYKNLNLEVKMYQNLYSKTLRVFLPSGYEIHVKPDLFIELTDGYKTLSVCSVSNYQELKLKIKELKFIAAEKARQKRRSIIGQEWL